MKLPAIARPAQVLTAPADARTPLPEAPVRAARSALAVQRVRVTKPARLARSEMGADHGYLS
jgi:hypothetical protein